MDLEIDDLTTGRRPLADTDSSDVTEYDPNSRLVMVDDPVTGRRPAITIADLFAYSGDHLHTMVDSLTSGRVPITIGAVSVWSPSALFASSEVGVWYDPSDLTTMFQDSAGTTPVTATGDPVGLILDKSGNGKHVSQATAASRPVYRNVGGYKYLEFDGVDDYMNTANLAVAIPQPISYFVGLYFTNVSTVMHITDGNSTDREYLLLQSGSKVAINSGSQVLQTDTVSASTPYVLTGIVNSASTVGRVNTTQVMVGDSGTNALGQIWLGANYLGGTNFNGRMYSMIIRGALSDATEIDDSEAWVNGKTGAY